MSTSVILQAASRASRRRSTLVVDAFAHALAFKHPGELLFGALLTYYFRLFERQMGTGKYGAYLIIVSGLSYAIEAVLTAATTALRPHLATPTDPIHTNHLSPASGLYPLLFANMVAFYLEVPSSLQRFTVLGFSASDKAFIYMAAAQLLLSNARRSVFAGLTGVLVGIVYHTGALGLHKVRLPKQLEGLFSATVGRVLGGGGGRAPRQHIYVTAPQPPPPPPPQQQRVPTLPSVEPSPELVQQLVEMGFDPGSARQALRANNNNVELALQTLL